MIGILTFYWADDYGAMLQAYALKRYLRKASKRKVEVIPYAPVRLDGRYWFLPVVGREKAGKVGYSLMLSRFMVNVLHLRHFLRRRKNMRRFRHRYLTKERPLRSADRVILKKYSCVFVGSDQVWNPEITVGLDPAYIGNTGAKGNCRLAAYGASFGKDSLPVRYRAAFEKAVNQNFSEISLREKSAMPFVKGLFHGNVTDVLDPTLLLGRKEWEKIAVLPDRKHYILFIHTEYNTQMMQCLQNLSKELGREVIQLTMPWPGQRTDWIDVEIEGGPSEYIGFFKNADYVVTNSFHGTVFSVLMEKPFFVFSHSNKNARMENLLGKLDLKQRLIEKGRVPSKEELLQEIDWAHVRGLLEKEREASEGFIKNVLTEPQYNQR